MQVQKRWPFSNVARVAGARKDSTEIRHRWAVDASRASVTETRSLAIGGRENALRVYATQRADIARDAR